MKSQIHYIIFFDGVCHFCNAWVNFVIKHDKNKLIYFAPLQSDFAVQYFDNKNNMDNESVIFINKGDIYYKSTAALKIFQKLGGMYRLLYYMTIWIPAFIRNFIYDIIAKNRYKWFGKYDSCMVPDEEVKERFLS